PVRPQLAGEDVETLQQYHWPGNVRELEKMMERAVVMGSQSGLYREEILRLRRGRSNDRRSPVAQMLDVLPDTSSMSLRDLERLHILRVLDSTGNNHKRAAEILGINPSTLWRKMKGYQEE